MSTNRMTTAVAILTTAFTLVCVGIFLLFYVNLRAVVGSLQDDIKVMVYLDDQLTPDTVTKVELYLRNDRAVASLFFISKEQALNDFKTQFPSELHLLEGLGKNPLPASFVVGFSPLYRSAAAVKNWAERVSKTIGVTKIDYNQDLINVLASIVQSIELVAIGIGAILSASAVTIIANTIRLTLYARRDEIIIMRLIGATTAFIRIPYLLEGAVLGAMGSALSLIILKLMFQLLYQYVVTTGQLVGLDTFIILFPLSVSLTLVIVGLCLGILGSCVSIRRFGEFKG